MMMSTIVTHKKGLHDYSTMTTTKRIVTSEQLELNIPRAQDWYNGMLFRGKNGHVLYCVRENESYAGSPGAYGGAVDYTMYLADKDGIEIESMVKVYNVMWDVWFDIYTKQPSFSGQSPDRHLTGGQNMNQDMFLYGRMNGDKEFKRVTEKVQGWRMYKDVGVCKYQSTSGGRCLFWGSTRRVVVAYDRTGHVILTRDQNQETLTIAADQDLLIGISLTYAIDRFYKFCGSKAERKQRARQEVWPVYGQDHIYAR
jgi:hypothetical protein